MYERIDVDEFEADGNAAELHRSVTRHCGATSKFVARHRRSVSVALERGDQGIIELGPFLLARLADPRMLRAAWNELDRDAAPGPNGHRVTDVEDHEAWGLARTLGNAIRSGHYRPGPDRRVTIPKGAGRGTRTITIQNVEDALSAAH